MWFTGVNRIIRKLHIYAGLLTFAQLLVYGIAGLAAAFHMGPERSIGPRSVEYVPFEAPPSSTDKQVAALAYKALHLPLTRPVPDWFLRRTPDNHLLLDFYNINGFYRVTVLERERRLRVENIRNSTWLFLEDIHAATPGDEGAPRMVYAWALWNEAAMWSLLGFCASGMWLWLSSRPRHRWAWLSAGAGSACLAVLWAVFR